MTMAYPGPPRRPAGYLRIALLTVFILLAFYHFRHAAQPPQDSLVPGDTGVGPAQPPTTPQKPASYEKTAAEALEKAAAAKDKVAAEALQKAADAKDKEAPAKPPKSDAQDSVHPIDTLFEKAEKEFEEVLKKETRDVKSAAKAYRERRGRHPPPGFDDWFKFAQEKNAVMVEDFFDQIYHDLNPFWGLSPATMRKEGWDYEMTINIRNNNATAGSDWFWTKIWLDLVKTIEHLLPDMDIPLNAMDEPRIVTPWETINEYMEIERKERSMPPAAEVSSEYQTLAPPGEVEKDLKTRERKWEDTREYLRSAY